jgi:hypothetical protein
MLSQTSLFGVHYVINLLRFASMLVRAWYPLVHKADATYDFGSRTRNSVSSRPKVDENLVWLKFYLQLNQNVSFRFPPWWIQSPVYSGDGTSCNLLCLCAPTFRRKLMPPFEDEKWIEFWKLKILRWPVTVESVWYCRHCWRCRSLYFC